MTVDQLDAPLQLPVLDIELLRKSADTLSQGAAGLGDIYMPVLQDTLKALTRELSVSDEKLLKVLTSLPVALDIEGASYVLKNLISLKNEPASDVAEVIEQLTKELINKNKSSIATVTSERELLDDALTNLNVISLKAADRLISEQEKELAPLKASWEKDAAPLIELEKQETVLNGLIDELEEGSILDKLKPLVESLKQLIKVDPKSPLIGVIEAGMEGVTNILNISKESINYSHLIKSRHKLQDQLDVLRAEFKALRDELGKVSHKLAQLQEFQSLGKQREVYMQEASKLVEALHLFLTQSRIDNSADVVEEVARFIENCVALTKYLDGLRRRWQGANTLVSDGMTSADEQAV
ncbi:alpha-xenorhabdolysin family binary toxin subunit B [Pseudomonas sp. NPDC090202]|uniref:alpha-xenorhabdolysin family binary toxin subunit B n=1 Tax=unclassified Pseudomonas TaxID=196821 RepID=UPI00381ADAFC